MGATTAVPGPGLRGPGTGWAPAASSFSWAPEVLRAERTPREIAVAMAGLAPLLELEAGQCFRSFPAMAEHEVQRMREALDATGARVGVLGLGLDDHLTLRTRRTLEERMAFLAPQLRAAGILGARGVRLPLGQAGPALLERMLPLLEEHDLVLLEEIQGAQDPADPPVAEALAEIASRDPARIRLLLDTSMVMPAPPVSYLDVLERAGAGGATVRAAAESWSDPAGRQILRRHLAEGRVPPPVVPLCMTLLVRFGTRTVDDLEPLLPLLGAVHLKFWDLEDEDGRVSAPLRALGAALRRHRFSGPLCSEWGGHDWLAEDPATMTAAHLRLAGTAMTASSCAPEDRA